MTPTAQVELFDARLNHTLLTFTAKKIAVSMWKTHKFIVKHENEVVRQKIEKFKTPEIFKNLEIQNCFLEGTSIMIQFRYWG